MKRRFKRLLILYALGPPIAMVGAILFCLVKAAHDGDLWLAVGAVAFSMIIMSVIGCVWYLAQWLTSKRA
jgi:hypothetical protein